MRPYKNKFVNIQELLLLINLTILHAVGVSFKSNGGTTSITANIMLIMTLLQFSTIVTYHFLTYTCHCNIIMFLVAIKKKLKWSICNKEIHYSYDIHLLNIPECAYNYTEYRDGLVSDDFNN